MLDKVRQKAVELYSETIVEHGINPNNQGTIENPDGYARITGVCGDTVEMFIRVRDGKIEESKFNTDGCMFSTAACSVAAKMAEGKKLAGCVAINQSAILKYLEEMPKNHEHCALLAAMTLQRAIRDCIEHNG